MSQAHSDNCFNCRFYLRFTQDEKASFEEKLRAHGVKRPVWGGCTAVGGGKRHLVRRYISAPVNECQYWDSGYYAERLSRHCPQCKVGEIVIRRVPRDKQTHLLIGCSMYSDCKFMAHALPLERKCKYCDVPLLLSGDTQLKCECPKCKRSIRVPLMLRGWPALFVPHELGAVLENGALVTGMTAPARPRQCVHGFDQQSCATCRKSLEDKISIIDLELPEVAAYWLRHDQEKAVVQKLAADDNYGEVSTLDDIPWSAEAEELDEKLRELDEWSADFARSSDEGWYYPD